MAKQRRYAPDAGKNKDRTPFYGSGNLSLAAGLAAAVLLAATLGFGGAVLLSLVAGQNQDEKLAARDAKIATLIAANRYNLRHANDQFCLLAERDHRSKVRALRGTYEYLVALPARERLTTLNKFVIQSLPKTEQEAYTDQAPQLCDRPGLGLPEPDPRIPRRPDFVPAIEGLPPVPTTAEGQRFSEAVAPKNRPASGQPKSVPERPQRPEGKPQTPSGGKTPQPQPSPAPVAQEPPPTDLTEPPRAPVPAPQRPPLVCITVPLVGPVCTP